MNDDLILSELMEFVIPLGKGNPNFLLYARRSLQDNAITSINMEKWPMGTLVTHFKLWDETWPCVIELIEIDSTPLSSLVELEKSLISGLNSVIAQGASLGWYMFDGAFGPIETRFSDWEIPQTYGIQTQNIEAQLALPKQYRKSQYWSSLLKQISSDIHIEYPGLDSIVYE
jgi:hypothetical protein